MGGRGREPDPAGDRLMAMIAAIALLIDVAIGWPQALYRRVGHPVTWLGRLIAALDKVL